MDGAERTCVRTKKQGRNDDKTATATTTTTTTTPTTTSSEKKNALDKSCSETPKNLNRPFDPRPSPVGVAVAARAPAVVVSGSAVEAGHDGLGQHLGAIDDPARDCARR